MLPSTNVFSVNNPYNLHIRNRNFFFKFKVVKAVEANEFSFIHSL